MRRAEMASMTSVGEPHFRNGARDGRLQLLVAITTLLAFGSLVVSLAQPIPRDASAVAEGFEQSSTSAPMPAAMPFERAPAAAR